MITKIKDLESKASSKSSALERKQQKVIDLHYHVRVTERVMPVDT